MSIQELYRMLYQTLNYMMWQAEKINRIEDQLSQLSEQLEQWMNKQQGTTIEKIDYHFDQLKIETLAGTLNIGMSPNGGPNIEDLYMNQHNQQEQIEMQQEDPLFTAASVRVSAYLNEDAYEQLVMQEHKYGCVLTPEQRKAIIEDIRRQLPARIRHYMQKPDTQEDEIVESVCRDIGTAIDTYMMKAYGGSSNVEEGPHPKDEPHEL